MSTASSVSAEHSGRHLHDGLLLPGLQVSSPIDATDPRYALHAALVAGEDGIEPSRDGLIVYPERLRGMVDETLAALGAPRWAGPIHVGDEGLLRSASYRWAVDDGTRHGPWLDRDGATYLLDAAHERVFVLADQVRVADSRHTRLRCLATLQQLAADDDRIVLSPRLAETPVHPVDAIQVDVTRDPIAGPIPRPRLVDSETGDEVPLDDEDLTRVAQAGLLRPASKKVKGQWILTTPGVARNTLLAATATQASRTERERFVENPTAFLPDDDAFDAADYADRVIGVGVVPPSATREGESERDWVGEHAPVGVIVTDIHGEDVQVGPDQVADLRAAVAGSLEDGEPHATFADREIPVSQALLTVLDDILGGQRPPGTGTGRQRSVIRVLLIADNEVVLDWAPVADRERVARGAQALALRVTLRPHQTAALRHLQSVWRAGGTGALLCDDMGLGKTLQALVFGTWVAKQVGAGGRSRHDEQAGAVDIPLCVVGPPSLLTSWLQELELRLGSDELPVVVWGQSQLPAGDPSRLVLPLRKFLVRAEGRGVVLDHARIDLAKLRAARPSVLLIGYDTLRRLQFAIGQIRFGALVADEVQQAKNPNSLRSRALRAMNVDFCLALTGTPIENSWRDLWTLCDFAVPGRLGTLQQFQQKYPPSGDIATVGRDLAATLAPVLIRRTRGRALEGLPQCTITPERRDMPELQAMAYRAALSAHHREGGPVLALLQRLASVSLHPRQRVELRTAAEADAWADESARTRALWAALRRFQSHQVAVLVFVRSIAMQQTLAHALRLAFGLDQVGALNGQLTMRQRTQLVERVRNQHGFRVMLVSPDVGGAGWNLQFAKRAVLLERQWNPAVEAQMIARIHRLGQNVAVEVVTPIATTPGLRTFDVILDELLTEKRHLAESVLAPAAVSSDELTGRFADLARGTDEPAPAPPSPSPKPDPGPPREATHTPAEQEPVREPAPTRRHALRDGLASASLFATATADVPSSTRQRALEVIDLLARSTGNAVSFDAYAQALGVRARRIPREVLSLGFLNRDGFDVLIVDKATRQVRLDVAVLRAQYELDR